MQGHRTCDQCLTGQFETKTHFLLEWKSFNEVRNTYLNHFTSVIPNFHELSNISK